jgi:hypothetical protein
MTTCTPLKPFRCWQYRKDSTEPVPEWVEWHYLEPYEGQWLVDYTGRGVTLVWYTPAEFAERFRVEEGK